MTVLHYVLVVSLKGSTGHDLMRTTAMMIMVMMVAAIAAVTIVNNASYSC